MRKANTIAVGVGVSVLLIAIGTLYVLLNRGEKPGSARSTIAKSGESSNASGTTDDVQPGAGTGQPSPTKTDDVDGETAAQVPEKVTEVYSSDGTRIRDYRTGDAPMRNPEAPFRKPLSVTKIKPALASRMGGELRKVANRCRSEHSAEVGEAAKVQPRATFEVKDGQLLVTDVEISLTNIPSGGDFESCLQSGVLGISVNAEDHPDIKEHKLMVPIDFPG